MKKKVIALAALIALSVGGFTYLAPSHAIHTDNAYIKADITTVSPQVGGQVATVFVQDNQWVTAGTPLFAIDDADYQANHAIAQAAVAVADAALANNASRLTLQTVNIEQAKAAIASAQANDKQQRADFARYQKLIAKASISQTQFDAQQTRTIDAKAKLDSARLALQAQQKTYDAMQSERAQLTAQRQQAQSKLTLSDIALKRTTVYAPVDGYVAHRQVQAGKFVQPGMGLITLVPSHIWLEANFKETQLTNMAPGQAVEVTLDMYPDTPITGTVESVTHATGAQFSLLPPQNATGNFVKVVQRVPVKITLQLPTDLRGKVYPGLSANVTVDTAAPQP